jgi:hypothetical protein
MQTEPRAWGEALIETVQSRLRDHPYWGSRFSDYLGGMKGLHLAVFVEPFLGFILNGTKMVESRFSANRAAPYELVCPGDAILLKRSCGPVVGISEVTYVWCYELDNKAWRLLRNKFRDSLCIDDSSFWKEKSSASFATLMSLDHIAQFPPVDCAKRDRRGWVLLRPRDSGSV